VVSLTSDSASLTLRHWEATLAVRFHPLVFDFSDFFTFNVVFLSYLWGFTGAALLWHYEGTLIKTPKVLAVCD